jgi:hypothetical protein
METNHERITQRKRPIDDVGNWKQPVTALS